jgi:hypothetical protein
MYIDLHVYTHIYACTEYHAALKKKEFMLFAV